MSEIVAVVLTDLVDSTRANVLLGDQVMARLWAAHDMQARELIRSWRGREVGRSDGFLVVFGTAGDAVGFADAYHTVLEGLVPSLMARVGIHVGEVTLRRNRPEDTEQGATPFEIDGLALPIAARMMAAATGGQTLLSEVAMHALGDTHLLTQSHGHWRFKGLAEPIEVFEVGGGHAPFTPPPDSAKAYRVVRSKHDWMPARDIANNLPAERDDLVGRQVLLADLAACFDEGARLVTLHGMGGIGKTRLALRFARGWLGDFPGGVWFCDLSEARSTDGMVHAVAQGLDVTLGKSDPVQQLSGAIAGRGTCLVVLDNFEQVARYADATLGTWLERAPEARFIATSRELLGIAGERAVAVPALDRADAIQMFVQRVHSLGLKSPLGAEDTEAIAPLVDLLDRLPLAIELASARVRVMRPRVLLQRMGDRFTVLAKRRAPRDRQATLRTMLDWSWELLSPAEQSLLLQLAVFRGGFTLEAAEAVVELDAYPEVGPVVDVVESVLEKSFVVALDDSRFGFLQTVLDYLLDRATGGSTPDRVAQAHRGALDRHARHFGEMPEHRAVADRCAELDNLVAACRHAVGTDMGIALRALENIWAGLRLVGPFRAIEPLLETVERAGPHAPERQAQLDWVAAGALHRNGNPNAALSRASSGLELMLRISDGSGQARMHLTVAEILRTLGRGSEAARHGELALSLAKTAGDSLGQLKALNSLGALDHGESRFDAARTRYEDALAIAERLDNMRWRGGLLGNLASIGFAQGRFDEAVRLYEQALEFAQHVGDRQWEGNNRSNLGILRHEMGDDATALADLEDALQIARSIGHGPLERVVLCNRGIVLEALARTSEAVQSYEQAVALSCKSGHGRAEGEFRGYLGLLMARLGRRAEAALQLESAAALFDASDDAMARAFAMAQRAVAAALCGDMTASARHRADAEHLVAASAIQPSPEWTKLIAEASDLSGISPCRVTPSPEARGNGAPTDPY